MTKLRLAAKKAEVATLPDGTTEVTLGSNPWEVLQEWSWRIERYRGKRQRAKRTTVLAEFCEVFCVDPRQAESMLKAEDLPELDVHDDGSVTFTFLDDEVDGASEPIAIGVSGGGIESVASCGIELPYEKLESAVSELEQRGLPATMANGHVLASLRDGSTTETLQHFHEEKLREYCEKFGIDKP
jgi:hypothetical protein